MAGSYDKVGHSQLMKAVLLSIFFMPSVVVNWLTSACPVSKTTAHNFIFFLLGCLRLSWYKTAVSVTDPMCFEYGLYTVMCDCKRGAQREKIHSITPTLLSITRL